MSNLAYLDQARKLLTEDYKTKHSNEYNSWLARQQHSWMQPHIVVPFPPFIVSAALAPFKPSVSAPSEEAVVAKALDLYNQFNPTPVAEPELVVEPVVEEPVVEQAPDLIDELLSAPTEELVIEPVVEEAIVEESIVEEPVAEPLRTNDAIYKIFKEPVIEEPTVMDVAETLPPTIEQALNVVPQPAEELARVKNSGRILPSVLERLQAMKDKWSSSGEKNV